MRYITEKTTYFRKYFQYFLNRITIQKTLNCVKFKTELPRKKKKMCVSVMANFQLKNELWYLANVY